MFTRWLVLFRLMRGLLPSLLDVVKESGVEWSAFRILKRGEMSL